MQYLTFQLFTAGPGFDTEGGVFRTIQKTQPYAQLIERRAADIVAAVGTTGEGERKLGIVVGPLCLDHTDDQLREIVEHGFEVAARHGIAVGFHIDDSKFIFRRSELWNQPANVETMDWDGTLNTGQYLNWGEEWKLAPQLCFNAEAVVSEARRVAGVIGDAIAARQVENPDLLAGVIAGWETSIGLDFETGSPLGYRALVNRGFSRANPPDSVAEQTEAVVREWVDVWAGALVESGVPRDRVYSHIVPSVVPVASSLIDNGLPGFTAYAGTGMTDEIYQMLQDVGHTEGWALAEGANVNIDQAFPRPGDDMHGYLTELSDHGASLINLFGWGVGSPGNAFRRACEGEAAIDAYRRWLTSS